MITDDEFALRLTEVDRLTDAGARFETEDVEIHGAVRRNYRRRPESLAAMFMDSVDRNATAVALVEADRSVMFEALADSALRIAADLQRRGVTKGDHVGILGANSIEWVEAFWACTLGGFISVPLNALWTRPELSYAIEHSEMVCCFVDEKRHGVVEGLLEAHAFIPLGSVNGLEPSAASEPGSPLSAQRG